MRGGIRRRLLALAVGIGGGLAALSPFGFYLEDVQGLDLLFAARGPLPAPAGVAVLGLHADAANGFARVGAAPGAWPEPARSCAVRYPGLAQLANDAGASTLPREAHACLIDVLTAAGAAAVAFDIVFVRGGPGAGAQAIAEAAARSGRVVLVRKVDDLTSSYMIRPLDGPLEDAGVPTASFVLDHETARATRFWTRHPALPPPHDVQLALRTLEMVAGRHGDDGHLPAVARRVPVGHELVTAALVGDVDPARLEAQAAIAAAEAPPDERLFNLYGPPGTITSHSVADVLLGRLDHAGLRAAFAGRAVFVGLQELQQTSRWDTFDTAFSRDGIKLSGVELGATAYANLLDGSSLHRPPPLVDGLLVAGLGTALTASAAWAVPVAGIALSAAIAVGWAMLCALAFTHQQLVLPVAVPLFVVLPLALGGGLAVRYLRACDGVRAAVPRPAAERLLRRGLDGLEERPFEATVMMTDVAGWSRLADRHGHDHAHRMLNELFRLLTPVVGAERGLVLNFVADAMTAYWPAQGDPATAAERACRAALGIERALAKANERFTMGGEPPLRLRIGINAGIVSAGATGAVDRTSYALVGETMNTTQRIERLGKLLSDDEADTIILIADGVRRRLGAGFLTRDLGPHPVPGRDQPVHVLRLLTPVVSAARRALLPAALLAVLVSGAAQAQEGCPDGAAPAALIRSAVAGVTVAGRPLDRGLLPEAPVCAGDAVAVPAGGRAEMRMAAASTEFRLDGGTELLPIAGAGLTTVGAGAPAGGFAVRLLRGAIYLLSRTPRRLTVETAFVTAGIDGTEVLLRVDPARRGTDLLVLEGTVAVTPDVIGRRLTTGQRLTLTGTTGTVTDLAPPGSAFGDPRAVTADALAWTLFYPDILVGTADPVIARAARLLASGRALEADGALETAPTSADRDALRAIITLTRRDVAAARPLVAAARRADPGSATALLAESYLRQQELDLDAALSAADAAARAAPTSGLARARLAELRLMRGETRAARAAAAEAAQLGSDPLVAIVQGYTSLAAYDTRTAESAFRAALRAESQNPLALLGLGLARIRRGDLDTGRGFLEAATVHDPTSALLRSYLGRAYFEERRDDVAGLQYDIAKQLDPADPTPWYFDAIRKQLANRPVEALRDVERSIALNDNRAPFRSRLLLEQDQAARGVSLARIYEDLGFTQLGVNEASRALAADPANAAAHRFLSDLNQGEPRLEAARLSEQLQAQLLQPVGRNPVQPSLTFSDLGILRSSGPSRVSFNEYSPLFQQDGVQLDTSVVGGSDYTFGDEAAITALAGRLSFSLGQLFYTTEGVRDNDDLQHEIYTAFVQAALHEDWDIQAEYIRRKTDKGDRERTTTRDLDDLLAQDRDEDVARIGSKLRLTPKDTVLLSAILGDREASRDTSAIDAEPAARIRTDQDRDGGQVELQYLHDAGSAKVVAGGGGYGTSGKFRLRFGEAFFGEEVDASVDADQSGGFGYTYSSIDVLPALQVTAGLSLETYDQTGRSDTRLLPKLGLMWSIKPWLAVRAAAFDTLKRGTVDERTLEPVQIAGFSQLYDEYAGSRTRTFALGVDVRPMPALALGIEGVHREVSPPVEEVFVLTDETAIFLQDHEEDLLRVYVYATATDRVALSAAAEIVRFRRDARESRFQPAEVDEYRVPITLAYYDPSGFFADLSATYVDQTVSLETAGAEGFYRAESDDDFLTLDATIGQRFFNSRVVLSLEGYNLLDQNLRYQDAIFRTPAEANLDEQPSPRFVESRTLLARLTMRF